MPGSTAETLHVYPYKRFTEFVTHLTQIIQDYKAK